MKDSGGEEQSSFDVEEDEEEEEGGEQRSPSGPQRYCTSRGVSKRHRPRHTHSPTPKTPSHCWLHRGKENIEEREEEGASARLKIE